MDNRTYEQPYEVSAHIFSKTYQSYNPATAFVVQENKTLQSLIGRITTYSMDVMEKRSKFVPSVTSEQQKIIENTQDQTAILMEDNSELKTNRDFSTLCCCC